jgi:hypothetical protein
MIQVRPRRLALSLGLVMMTIAREASAQPYIGSTGSDRGTVEIGAGGEWTGGYDAGSANATETRPGGGPPLTLFTVSSRMLSAPGAWVQVGVFLARRVSAEATFHYGRPVLRARITNDFESAPDTDADGTVTSYLFGGSLLYHFGDGRFAPFVSGGGGYLRQLHEANSDLLTGTEVHAGGGIKAWLGTGGHRFGLRVDAQVSARSKSAAFEQKRRIVPTFGAGVEYQF